MSWRLGLGLLIVLGCDGSDTAVPDGGLADAEVDALPAVARARAVDFTPCPDGWTEVTGDDGQHECLPYPDGRPDECPPGEAHFPGTPGCAPIGRACPEGPFPEVPEDTNGPWFYVAPDATDGDGTKERPFGRINDAVAADARRIALGKGTHPFALVDRRIEIVGACTTETTIASFTQGESIDEGYDRLSNLSLGALHVRRRPVILESVVANSIEIRAHAVVGHRVVARARSSRAVGVDRGGTLTLDHALIESGFQQIELTDVGTVMELRDTAVLFGEALPNTEGSELCVRIIGGFLSAERTVWQGCPGVALGVFDDARVWLRHGRIEQSATAPSLTPGRAVAVQEASFRAERVVVADRAGVGFHFDGADAALHDVAVRGIRDPGVDAGIIEGHGIVATGVLDAARVRIEDVEVAGMVLGAGRFDLEDLTVRNVQPATTGFGYGWTIQDPGADVRAERISVTDVHSIGVMAAGGEVSLADVEVRGLAAPRGPRFGAALVAQQEGALTVERALVRGVDGVGLMALRASLDAKALDVEDVRERPCDGADCEEHLALGIGIGSYVGGQITLDTFTVDSAALCGLYLGRDGALVAMGGTVRGAAIGLCADRSDRDLGSITSTVRFVDNGTSLSALDLPVPELASVPMIRAGGEL